MSSFTKVHMLFHIKLTYLPTQTMPSFKDSSTEYSHIISHKACLFNNSCLQATLSSSHPKHVFFPPSITKVHPLTKTCLSSKALPQKFHISSHTNHAFFQRLFHRKFTHPLTQQMSFYMSAFNETESAYVKDLPRKGNLV